MWRFLFNCSRSFSFCFCSSSTSSSSLCASSLASSSVGPCWSLVMRSLIFLRSSTRSSCLVFSWRVISSGVSWCVSSFSRSSTSVSVGTLAVAAPAIVVFFVVVPLLARARRLTDFRDQPLGEVPEPGFIDLGAGQGIRERLIQHVALHRDRGARRTTGRIDSWGAGADALAPRRQHLGDRPVPGAALEAEDPSGVGCHVGGRLGLNQRRLGLLFRFRSVVSPFHELPLSGRRLQVRPAGCLVSERSGSHRDHGPACPFLRLHSQPTGGAG